MAKYKIVENKKGFKIQLEEILGQEEELMTAFQACQEGRCSCPTDEYKKLESMELDQKGDNIKINLISKEGTELDKHEIEQCLDFTTSQANKKKNPN